jgi:hypothetical protein
MTFYLPGGLPVLWIDGHREPGQVWPAIAFPYGPDLFRPSSGEKLTGFKHPTRCRDCGKAWLISVGMAAGAGGEPNFEVARVPRVDWITTTLQ